MSLLFLFKLPTSFSKLRRLRRIVSVLTRHGFADVADRTGLARGWTAFRRAVSFGRYRSPEAHTTGERLRLASEELGPTFIKFGQVLANRPDILPPDVIDELSKLQDDVPPFPFEHVREVLSSQLSGPVDEVFERIDEVPLAAASIAQVHRAKLRTGEEVVLKVKRPGIARTIREDLAILHDLAAYLEQNAPELRGIRPIALVEEFSRTIQTEMDFRFEVSCMERFARNHADDPALAVPKPFKELCTSDLIVMEYMDGLKLAQIRSWEELGLDPKALAEIGTRMFLRSVFVHRFFHGDPHAGNLLVLRDGRLCLLDFGMMGTVDQERMEEMLSFMVALLSYDADMLVDAVLNAGLAPEGLNQRELKRDVDMMLNRFAGISLEELNIEVLLRTATQVIFRHRISLPADLLLIGRALVTMEGIARRIYPAYNPLEAIQPFLISVFLKRALDPSIQSQQIVDGIAAWMVLAKQLPQDIREVTDKLKRGQLTLRLDDVHAPAAAAEAARRTNRVVGTLLAALGLATTAFFTWLPDVSSLVPYATGAATLLLSLWVLWGIRKSGGM